MINVVQAKDEICFLCNRKHILHLVWATANVWISNRSPSHSNMFVLIFCLQEPHQRLEPILIKSMFILFTLNDYFRLIPLFQQVKMWRLFLAIAKTPRASPTTSYLLFLLECSGIHQSFHKSHINNSFNSFWLYVKQISRCKSYSIKGLSPSHAVSSK